MTDSDTRPARANRGGHPCPPWCAEDHSTWDVHASHTMTPGATAFDPRVRLKDIGLPGSAAFIVLNTPHGCLWIVPADAGTAASALEDLAECAPYTFQSLAREIEAAAALLAGKAE